MPLRTIILDAFTGTYSTLDARTPDTTNTPGNAWVAQTGTFKNQAAQSPYGTVFCTPNSDANGDTATIDTGVADFTFTCDLTDSTGPLGAYRRADLIFRWVDSSNYWRLSIGGNPSAGQVSIAPRFDLIKRQTGSDTTVASGSTMAVATDSKDSNPGTYTGDWLPQSGGSGYGNLAGALLSPTNHCYIDCGSPANLDLNRSFTLEAWIKSTGISGTQAIMSHGQAGYYLRLSSSKLNFLQSQTADIASANTTLSSDTWYHVAVKIDGSGNGTFYLNGATDGTFSTAVTFTNSNKPFTIGGENGGGSEPFSGTIDAVAVYSSALSDSAIQNHYDNRGSGYDAVILAESTLISYWELNDPLSGIVVGTLYTVQVVTSGNSIIVKLNSTQEISVSNAFNNTATVVGIYLEASGAVNTAIAGFDNFTVAITVSGGGANKGGGAGGKGNTGGSSGGSGSGSRPRKTEVGGACSYLIVGDV